VKVEAPRRAVTMAEVRAHRNAIKRLGERFGVWTPGGLKLWIRDHVLREAVAL
jgi:hypothetical protein